MNYGYYYIGKNKGVKMTEREINEVKKMWQQGMSA
jgi:hypothetical protein